MGDYWFFLSYARRDATGDPLLKKFFEDLALQVGRVYGLPSGVTESEIGFFDAAGIEAGNEWPETLANALQKTKVLVCIYSNAYFKSEFCGKEFQIFQSRLKIYRSEHGISPPLILPVLWSPIRILEQMPQAVANIQYNHAALGETYAREGLDYLIRTKRKPEYQEFIIRFAEQIVRNAKKHDLPPLTAFPDVESVPSAFHPIAEIPPPLPTTDAKQLPVSNIVPRIAGPDVAWYVYFAGRRADYEGIRTRRECYGQRDGREWQPHLPPINKRVGVISQSVALEKNILTDVLPVSPDLIKNLREAEDTNTIAVLIVDPWSVRFESYRELMSHYDNYSFLNCGVIIVWNDNDEETKQNRDALQAEIRGTFDRSLASEIFFRDSIQTEDEFRAELSTLIEKVRDRLMKRGKAVRPIPTNSDELFPTISGQ